MSSQPKLDPNAALALIREKLTNGQPLPTRSTTVERSASGQRVATKGRPASSQRTVATRTVPNPSMLAGKQRPQSPAPAAPSEALAENTSELVRATVIFIKREEGFGFALGRFNGTVQKIFFRLRDAVQIDGHDAEPVFTKTPATNLYISTKAPRPTEILAHVEPSTKAGLKPRAVEWGVCPKRNWRYEAIKRDNGYADYVGGTIRIRANYGSYGTEEVTTGTIAAIGLSLDELNLVIEDAKWYNPSTCEGRTTETLALCYKMEDAYLDAKNERTPERNRRKTIIAPSIFSNGEVRITINKPSAR